MYWTKNLSYKIKSAIGEDGLKITGFLVPKKEKKNSREIVLKIQP